MTKTDKGNYITAVIFTKTDQYGSGPADEDDVYTVDQFCRLCEIGIFVDYDGFGYPVKDKKADPMIGIHPSCLEVIPADATHIVWYNR